MSTIKSFRLLLLRHGNTFNAHEIAVQVGRKTDLALTEKGRIQAYDFAVYLQQQKLVPAMIFCGSLQRQRQTAQILKSTFKNAILKPHQEALDEIDYGEWEGLTPQEIQAKWPDEYQNWQTQAIWPQQVFQGSLSHHSNALQAWLTSLLDKVQSGDLIVAITSNGIIRLMLQWIPELWQKLINECKIDNYKVGTGHYCDLTMNNLVPTLNGWNCKPEGSSEAVKLIPPSAPTSLKNQ